MKIKKAIEQFERWEESGWSKSEVPNTYMLILAKKALERQLNNGWILVAERLPNRETGCLVWQKIDGHYKYNIWHYVTDFPSSVIAWQPLPKPFKEVE